MPAQGDKGKKAPRCKPVTESHHRGAVDIGETVIMCSKVQQLYIQLEG